MSSLSMTSSVKASSEASPSLTSILPKPKNHIIPRVVNETIESSTALTATINTDKDVQVHSTNTTVGISRNEIIARIGHAEDRIIQTKLGDTQPKYYSEEHLARPDVEQVNKETEETKRALQALIMEKTAKTQPKNALNSAGRTSQMIKYTPKSSQMAIGHNSGVESRIINMVSMPVDPLEPPKFHHKRIPRAPPSPPAPRLHSPPRKVTAEEQKAWFIPPCISSWKNPKGYTVPLDKRLASDGKALQEKSLNNRISDLAEALFLAEKHNREEVEIRAAVERKVAEQERKKKDEQLRQIAEKAREESRRLQRELRKAAEEEESYLRDRYGNNAAFKDADRGLTIRERERLFKERDYEREREFRLSKMSAERRAQVLERETDRDVSERIALGTANPSSTNKESLFDERLFDKNAGLGTGFGAGDDDMYNLYDKPLFSSSAIHMIYKPQIGRDQHGNDPNNNDNGDTGEASREGHHDTSSKRRLPKPDKAFTGTNENVLREGPVQFEKKSGEDPFGLDKFLAEAKKSKKQ